MNNKLINVLIYSGSDMCQEYEYFCTNASKQKVVELFLQLERNNRNHVKDINPLDIFEQEYIYNVICDTNMSVCLSLEDIKLLKIDLELDLDDIYKIIDLEDELITKYCD